MKKRTFQKTFCSMQICLELQFLVDDLVDFLELSISINASLHLFDEVDKEPKHEKKIAFC